MKTFVMLLILIATSQLALAQRKIKKLEVREQGRGFNIVYKPKLDAISQRALTIKITPVSADSVNKTFNDHNWQSGQFAFESYEKSRRSYFLKKAKAKKKKVERTTFEYFLDALDWLEEEEELTEEEYNHFHRMLVNDYVKDNEEPSEEEALNVISNPYIIGSRYLSLFRIEFTNLSESPIAFDERLSVQNGPNLFENLTAGFILGELSANGLVNQNRRMILESLNLNTPILLLPNTKTVKYFSTVPLDPRAQTLEIGINNFGQFKWVVETKTKSIDRLYSYFEFDIYLRAHDQTTRGAYFLLKNANGSAYLSNGRLFVSSEDMGRPLEIVALTYFSNHVQFGRIKDILGSNLIDAAKNKRQKVIIPVEIIDVD